MKSEITVNDFSKHLFWDVDLSDFELDKYPEFMVQRVLEYGLMNDWNLLKKYYGMEKIREASLNLRTLDPVSLSFISTIFNIEKENFRCYKHRQLVQNSWNS